MQTRMSHSTGLLENFSKDDAGIEVMWQRSSIDRGNIWTRWHTYLPALLP